MNALNAAFASKMAEVYHCYKRRSVKKENVKISPLWVKAFNAYMDDSAVIIVLAQMAAAHILGDLETLIFLNPVTREEYDQVFDDIADCVAITTNGQISSGSFIDQLYRCMQPVVDPFRNWAVSTMRKRAWHMYEERIRFSQR